MKEEKNTTRWFIRPRDVYTKDRVGETLGPSAVMAEIKVMVNGEIKAFRVWEVEYSIIDYMEKSPNSGYKFEAYRLKQGATLADKWLFGKPKKLARTREVKKVKEELVKKK